VDDVGGRRARRDGDEDRGETAYARFLIGTRRGRRLSGVRRVYLSPVVKRRILIACVLPFVLPG
jgi:hypothetical protein